MANLKSYDKKVVVARALENMKEASNFLSMTDRDHENADKIR